MISKCVKNHVVHIIVFQVFLKCAREVDWFPANLCSLCPRGISTVQEPSRSKTALKKVTFNLSRDEESEGEEMEESEGEKMEEIFGGKTPSPAKSESKSSFEKRQEKVPRLWMWLLIIKHFNSCRPFDSLNQHCFVNNVNNRTPPFSEYTWSSAKLENCGGLNRLMFTCPNRSIPNCIMSVWNSWVSILQFRIMAFAFWFKKCIHYLNCSKLEVLTCM